MLRPTQRVILKRAVSMGTAFDSTLAQQEAPSAFPKANQYLREANYRDQLPNRTR